MQVSDVMSREALWLNPDNSLAEARDIMEEFQIRSLPVVEGWRVVGVISHGDILLHADLAGDEPVVADTCVGDVMTEPVTCSSTDSLADVAAVMVNYKLDELPVVDYDELAGTVSSDAMLDAMDRHGRTAERDALMPYVPSRRANATRSGIARFA